MKKRRVGFDEFDVFTPKGHKLIIDKDATTDYLFVNAPKDIYTVCFNSGMPMYDQSVLNGYDQSGFLEIKLPDRKIIFYCPYKSGNRKDGLWFFNIEFVEENGDLLFLPGQVLVNSDKVYRKTVSGKLPFVQILEKIKLKISTAKSV